MAFPEGRSREKAAGGCRDTRGGSGERGIERGGLQFRNGFHSADDDRPPSFSSSCFHSMWPLFVLFHPVPFFVRHSWGGSAPFPSAVACDRGRGRGTGERERERERERKREKEGTDGTLLNWMEKP